MGNIYQCLQTKIPDKAAKFSKLTTRGLLSKEEKKLVCEALQVLGKQESQEENLILENIEENRRLNDEVKRIEDEFNQINHDLAEQIKFLIIDKEILSIDTIRLSNQIAHLINISEHNHRLEQVRTKISQFVLTPLYSKINK